MIAATFADGEVYVTEDVLLQRLDEYTDEHRLSAFGMLVEGKGWVIAIQPGWRLCPTCRGHGYPDNIEGYPECSACDKGWVPDEQLKVSS